MVMTPDTWWHYTDVNGLLGVLDKRKLWASCVGYLNDTLEVEFGLSVLKDILEELGNPLESIWPVESHPLERSPLDVYAVSFSTHGDLLSQWRGYANGAGFTIAFDPAEMKFSETVGGVDSEPYRVRYGHQARNELKLDVESRLSAGQGQLDENDAWALLRNLPRYKHGSFAEEQEWRVAVLDPGAQAVQFRPRNGRLLPYVEIPVPDTAITEIRLGPGARQADIDATRLALKRYGWNEEIRISQTTSPYR